MNIAKLPIYLIRKLIVMRVNTLFRSAFKSHLFGKYDADTHISLPDISPVIVIGMHRSGTTLLTKILMDLGVHMGRNRGEDTQEAMFFQALNEAVINMTHSAWDYPLEVQKALQGHENSVAYALKSTLMSNWSRYNGWSTRRRAMSGETHWGWKDPRNTITLAWWLKIFPKARVINIYRNGIDVANSLEVRNKRLSGWMDISLRSVDLKGGLGIWEEYILLAEKQLKLVPEKQQLSLVYETLIQKPEETISMVTDFLSISIEKEKIKEIASTIQNDRSFSFVNDEKLSQLYKEFQTNPVFKKLGYENII